MTWLRIAGGALRGRRLRAPAGRSTRPTAEKVRAALFNILGQRLEGETVLDLYAGSGALGLEALSRGAARAVLVDGDPRAVAAARQNAEALGLSEAVEVRKEDALRAVAAAGRAGERYTLVLADAPYAARVVAALLTALDQAGVVAPGGRVVCEHGRGEQAPERVGSLARTDQRRYGDTVLSFYVRTRGAECGRTACLGHSCVRPGDLAAPQG